MSTSVAVLLSEHDYQQLIQPHSNETFWSVWQQWRDHTEVAEREAIDQDVAELENHRDRSTGREFSWPD